MLIIRPEIAENWREGRAICRMSRFEKLEFNKTPPAPHPVAAAEANPLAEAERAFRKGDFERALRLFSKALELQGRQPEAWIGQVRALIELGDFSEASLWADKAMELFPNDPETLAAKAVALARLGDAATALAFSDSAVSARGESAYIWIARGEALLARRETRADFCFEKALALQPNDWFIACLISRAYYFYREFASALKWAQQAAESGASEMLPWLQLGYCQSALGLVSAARNSFSQARQLDRASPCPGRALAELGQAGFAGRLRGIWRRLRRH